MAENSPGEVAPTGPASTRRQALRAAGVGITAGLAGCPLDSGGGGSSGPTGQLHGPDGQVELTLIYTEGSATTETTAEFIAQELGDVGLSVSLESVTFERLLQQYVRNQYVGEGEPAWSAGPNNAGPRDQTASPSQWDLMYGITFNTYPRTPAAIDAFWLERSPTNYYGYVPEADLESKFSQFRQSSDTAERQQIIAEIYGILSRDQPVNFLAMSDSISGYRQKVVGPEEAFGANWDSTTWYFDEGDGRDVGGEWIAASTTDAEGLYFPEINDGASNARVALTLDGAYDVDENNEVQPMWMDVTDSGDSQVFVCELRDNLRWGGDYGRMTAEDWVFQIEQVHKSADMWNQDTPPSTQTGDWDLVEHVEQTGELEFQVELGSPYADFPLEPVLWGAFCAPKELYESYAPDAQALRTSEEFQTLSFTGNLGPYSFERWERSAAFVATRNDEYYMRAHADEMGEAWANAPYFEKYTYRVITEQASRMAALQEGEVTSAGIPSQRYQDFVENDEVDVYEVPQPFLTIVAYNQRRNGWTPLRKREIRQALSMAVNKRTVTEDIMRGLAEWTHTFQPRWSTWYDDSQVTPFGVDDSYDKEEARQLLAEHTPEEYAYEEA